MERQSCSPLTFYRLWWGAVESKLKDCVFKLPWQDSQKLIRPIDLFIIFSYHCSFKLHAFLHGIPCSLLLYSPAHICKVIKIRPGEGSLWNTVLYRRQMFYSCNYLWWEIVHLATSAAEKTQNWLTFIKEFERQKKLEVWWHNLLKI